MVQWLRLRASSVQGVGQGTKIPHAVWRRKEGRKAGK